MRILVIDDEVSIRDMTFEVLTTAGYDVVEAIDGDEGLSLHRAEPADLIITDLYMPEKDGFVVVQELKRDKPDVKIIAISGGGRYGNTSALEVAKRLLGDENTLRKPFTPNELLEVVEMALGHNPTKT